MFYSFFSYLLQPIVLLHFSLGLAVASLWWRRGVGLKRLLVITVLYLAVIVISLPVTGHLALGSLEWDYPPLEHRPEGIDAIVVLSGGVIPQDSVRQTTEPSSPTLYRCLHAAELYGQSTPCRVFVLGGKLDPQKPGPADALVMAELLVQLGVDRSDIVAGGTSQNTYENAVEFSRLRESHPCEKILLVTDAIHLRRATLCFGKLGIEVIPAGCQYQATELSPSIFSYLPNLSGAASCQTAAHEWIGLAWYRLKGRI